MSAERRRLRRDIDIQETATGVSGYMIPEHWPWVRVNGEDYPIHRRLLDILTEPIPEEPSGEPQVGDAVPYAAVGQNATGTVGGATGSNILDQREWSGFMADPTPPVQLRGERLTAMEEDTKWLLEALADPIPPVQPDDRLDQLAQQVQAIGNEVFGDLSGLWRRMEKRIAAIEERLKEAEENLGCTEAMRRQIEERLTAMEERSRSLTERMESAEANVADHEQAIGRAGLRVEALEEDASVQRVKHDGLAMEVASLTPAPAVAAGGEGPDVEEVVEWLEDWVFTNKDAVACRDAAIRLIRAGQQDTRPVLTPEMVDKACRMAFPGYWFKSWAERSEKEKKPVRDRFRRALRSTGAFREVPDG